jgi:hypothetical protein
MDQGFRDVIQQRAAAIQADILAETEARKKEEQERASKEAAEAAELASLKALSDSRATEFIELLQDQGVPMVDIYGFGNNIPKNAAQRPVIGQGWIISEPATPHVTEEGSSGGNDGLALLPNLSVYKLDRYTHKPVIARGHTAASVDDNMKASEVVSPFASDDALDLLVKAAVRLGAV